MGNTSNAYPYTLEAVYNTACKIIFTDARFLPFLRFYL